MDPPGLTVMIIPGGIYRVTAAHRMIWTWMNKFDSILEDNGFDEHSPDKPSSPMLKIGDLVSLTIVDVFETDNQGKIMSYCPIFDNLAAQQKTNQAVKTVRKTSSKFFSMLGQAQKAVAKSEVKRKAKAQLTYQDLFSVGNLVQR
jgi:hypothetical protein